ISTSISPYVFVIPSFCRITQNEKNHVCFLSFFKAFVNLISKFLNSLKSSHYSSLFYVSGDELNKFVLLLLGCAVQSDKKKTFVNRITKLEKCVQQGIAKEIQKVRSTPEGFVGFQKKNFLVAASEREKLRAERDESVMSLIDARKKFAQFQAEFGRKFEHEAQVKMELETQKTQRLREDLVSEKSKGAELVSRLRSVCSAIALNGGKIESRMSDNELIDSIDDVIMAALTTAKREADALRLQQHTQIAELNDLKSDIEKLRRSESVSLNESDDRVRELSKENVALKEQVFLVQEKVREQQVEIAAKNSEILAAKRRIEELNRNATAASASNTELARLQVSLRNAQLQVSSSMHQALLSDHDRLQNLHDLLTHDYERTRQENADMKTKLKLQQRVRLRFRYISSSSQSLIIPLSILFILLLSFCNSQHPQLLTKVNRVYEEENKNLGRQVVCTEKWKCASFSFDKFHIQERLSALQRHKEKLEEKIMDQYRSMESKKVTERQKQPLVKRAAKALINRRRPPVPSGGGSTTEDSSVYSADEGSPPLTNGKCVPEHSTASTLVARPSKTTHTSAAPRPSAPAPVLTLSAQHGRSSLRLPSFKKRPTFRDDTFQGAYSNPNVKKMIDVQYVPYEN
ncbi:unnamed protein product, partial [Angiostrongylus costaricensis]|uniref:HOOK_N domain-containing protein n=1 Tax=Angiostrongylus costaricensis TaxID=334426 RepID=A0A158PHS6_ANGCS